MDNYNCTTNKSHKRPNKSHKAQSWKIIDNDDVVTSDHDSDGTTGSIENCRARENSSSNCSSIAEEFDKIPQNTKDDLNVVLDNDDKKKTKKTPHVSVTSLKEKSKKISTRKGLTKKGAKRCNYTNKYNDKIKSTLNGVLMALIIASGLAGGHFIAERSRPSVPHVTTALLHRYINMSIKIYQQLIDENTELRSRVYYLENIVHTHSKSRISNIDIDSKIIQNPSVIDYFIKYIGKEINISLKRPFTKKLKNKLIKNTIIENDEDGDENEALNQDQLKREKFEKTENIAKGENVKNIQGDLNENETFRSERERLLERLDADLMNKNNICERNEYCTSCKPLCYKNGYVYNIKKLFEPNNSEECSITSSRNSIRMKPTPENQLKNEIQSENKQKQITTEKQLIQIPSKSEDIIEVANKIEVTSTTIEKPDKITEELINPYDKRTVQPQNSNKDKVEKYISEEFNLQPEEITDKKTEIRDSKRKPKDRSKENSKRNRTRRNNQNKQSDVLNIDQ